MTDKARTLIIIPTYNEVENIPELYRKIKGFAPGKDILFVDDNSFDGSIQAIGDIIEKDKTVNILIRKNKEGLAKAYIDGFKWGLKKDYDWFQEMDADFSHDPKYLPLFDRYKADFDVIIASRYIKEGEVEKWNPFRNLLSHGGCYYLRLVFGDSITDLTGGFNCWKRKVLEDIDLSGIISCGFVFQAEMKFAAAQLGYKIKEIPFIFKERQKGKSKFSMHIIIEGLLKPYLVKAKYRKKRNENCIIRYSNQG